MSTSKLDTSGIFQPLKLHSPHTELTIPANSIRFRKNGVEFTALQSIPRWTELTVDLRSPLDGKRVHATGIVVECSGNRHAGYLVAIVFFDLTRQAQERLRRLASSQMI